MNSEYITMDEAARIAGYRSASSLHAAARAGRLRIFNPSPRHHLTTRPWLEEYLASVKPRGVGRGEPRDSEALDT